MDSQKKNKVAGLWKKLPLKIKLAIIGIGFSIFINIIFLIVMITPLMSLGIIDIEGLGGSGGLDYSPITYLDNISNECETIIVDGKAWSLEDYVAGVISAEAYNSENMEALKAQAIASRTYAIVRTNYCTNSIVNSSAAQNFTSEFTDKAKQAASETAGIVLTYNSELFLSEYDSFYTGGDYSCNGKVCSVTYTKEPNNETHKVTVNEDHYGQINGGHGRGMSQVASYVLADQGKTFDYILEYFYSPGVKLMSMSSPGEGSDGLSGSVDGFTRRTEVPSENNSSDKEFYYSNNNVSYQAGFVGQCTWYAFGRANEILSHAGSDLRWKYAPHAKYWLEYNISDGANAFSYSKDVTKPKVGAIIVWSSAEYGHVAVVEAVNSDGTIDYSEANISSAKTSSNPYGFRYQSHINYTETGVGNISNIWSGYSFEGYIYMIE